MPALSTRSCVRSPLLLRVLEVFPSGFPRSHLAYPIRSMHRTRADGMYPYAKKILPEETQSICHIRPTALLVDHDFAYLSLGALRQVAYKDVAHPLLAMFLFRL